MRDNRIRRSMGISGTQITVLALLGIPRAVAHDLDLVGPAVNGLLVFVPLAIWLAVVLWQRVSNAFRTLLTIGAVYGALLAVTHQVFWSSVFNDAAPSLGGNLEGVLAPGVEGVVLRIFAVGSSLLTGLLVGAITGAAGWALTKLVPGFGPRRQSPERRD